MNDLIDVHCHINFFKNAGEIALNCEQNKVHTIYVTTLPSQFDETYKYVKDLKYVYPSLGFHCLEIDYQVEQEKKLFLKNIDNTEFIGEVGLDFSKKSQQPCEKQLNIFKFVLKAVQNKNKILSVHSLNAEDDVLKLLLEYKLKRVVFHWYSGKIGTLNKILKSGYYFSINLAMCRSQRGQKIIVKIPKDKILIETDAPFIKDLLPYSNDEVYIYLSKVWDIKVHEVKKQVLNNFSMLLNSNNQSVHFPFYEKEYANV